jgi:hypothetical protein
VEIKNMSISRDARILEYMLRQTSELWKVVNVLADIQISRGISQRSGTRSSFVGGGAPARPNRMHEDCGSVRRQSADGVLRTHFQG